MNQRSFQGLTKVLGFAKSHRANRLKQSKNRRLLMEGLERRELLAAFQADSFAVYRVGDGVAALSSAGTAVFIDEYSSTGTLLQSIALPTTVSGAQKRLVGNGTSTSEGMLTRSTDGNYLVLAGYDAALATANVQGANGATVNRVIGRIDGTGVVDTSTALADFASTNSPRSVATTNGTDFWAAGGNGGLRYTTFGSTTSTQINTAPGANPITNLRTVSIQGGQLYLSTQSGSAVRVGAVGTGTPTTATQNTTPLPGLPTTTGSPYQFFLADLDAGVPGVDTLYLADDTTTASGGIFKYSLVGGTWTANGSISGAPGTISGNRGLTGKVSGSTVTLIGTSASALFTVVDTTGYNAAFSSPTITALATAGANRAFRGVALSPVSTVTQVSVAATDTVKTEGNTGTTPSTSFTFTVTRTGPVTGTSSVDYAITGSGGIPANASDFVGGTLPTGTVNFLANEISKTITINVVGDTDPEADEGFTLTLSNPVDTSISTATAVGSILNDDAAVTFAIAATDAVKAEGTGSSTAFTFTITRTGTSGTDTVDFAVTGFGSNAANATDFEGGAFPTGTVEFSPGMSSQVVTVLVAGDTTVELSEGFQVALFNGSIGTAIIVPTATGTIQDDDSLVSITGATNVSLAEGNSGVTTFTFTLTRSGIVSGATDVSWSVAGSGVSPASADDFVGGLFPSGTVSFLASETTKTVAFDVQSDLVIESSETFALSLTSATNNTSVGVGLGNGTIVNDDFQALAPGDIVITAINTDNPDQFSFVPLVDLLPGAQIAFTDNGWTGTALTTNEGTITYTAPVGGVAKGSKIVVEFTSNTNLSVVSGVGSVTGAGSFAFAAPGDSLLAYVGLSTSPSFVYAVTTFGEYIATGSITTNNTYLPSTLVVGTSAVGALGPTVTTDVDNGQYDHTLGTSGSAAAIRTLVGNKANWLTSDDPLSPLNSVDFTIEATVTPTINATLLTKVYDNLTFSPLARADDGPGGLLPDTDQANFTYTFYAGPGLTGGVIAAPENVGSYSVDVSYLGSANYSPVASTAFDFSITPFDLTGSITAANKVFDGNTSATILTRTLATVFPGDTVSYDGGTATFATSAVGTGIVVTATGLSLIGPDAGNYTVNSTATTTANITAAGSVVNRRVFYNGGVGGATAFGASTNFSTTGGNPPVSAIDSKVALLPGQNSSFTNYTNVSFGLNGIIVDIANPSGTLTAADFLFAKGETSTQAGFVAFTPTELSTTIVPVVTEYVGGGVSGSTRAKITFNNNSLRNTWVRVTVLANANTGLATNDVFYFGNAVGDVNGSVSGGRYVINPTDTGLVRSNQLAFNAPVTNIYDFNKSGTVTPTDTGIVRSNQSGFGILRVITGAAARGVSSLQAPAILAKSSTVSNSETVPVFGSLGNTTTLQTVVVPPAAGSTDAAVKELFAQSPASVPTESSQAVGSIDEFFAQLGSSI